MGTGNIYSFPGLYFSGTIIINLHTVFMYFFLIFHIYTTFHYRMRILCMPKKSILLIIYLNGSRITSVRTSLSSSKFSYFIYEFLQFILCFSQQIICFITEAFVYNGIHVVAAGLFFFFLSYQFIYKLF